MTLAVVAQLVERWLPKPKVASSSLVYRSFLDILMAYFVYILQSQLDRSYYYGHTNDLEERLRRHNSGREKYTGTKLPWDLVWQTEKPTKSEAMKLEKKLKNLRSHKKTEAFIRRYS